MPKSKGTMDVIERHDLKYKKKTRDVIMTLRLDPVLVKRVDGVQKGLILDRSYLVGLHVSRSDVLRAAIEAGLDVIEKDTEKKAAKIRRAR
jgi:hypothetical protein